MQSVYIETTIPSYYFETRRSPTVVAWHNVTRHWWHNCGHHYRLLTSPYVLAELSLAPRGKAAKGRALLADLPILDDPPGLREVVEYYIEHLLMPADAEGDAVHLALASMHHIDFLLTWNCQHLANANKMQHLSILNGRLGLPVPIVTTPLTMMPEALP